MGKVLQTILVTQDDANHKANNDNHHNGNHGPAITGALGAQNGMGQGSLVTDARQQLFVVNTKGGHSFIGQ
jgi:glucokinase